MQNENTRIETVGQISCVYTSVFVRYHMRSVLALYTNSNFCDN